MNVEKIIQYVQRLTGYYDVVDPDVNLSVYGLDSLARVELVIILEDELNINFQDSDLSQKNFETVNNIHSLLKTYGVK